MIAPGHSSPSSMDKPGISQRPYWQQAGCLALLSGLIILASLVIWGVLRFSMPESPLLMVGALKDFGNGQEPQLFWKDNTPFYIVRSGNKVIALSPYSRRVGFRCVIYWSLELEQFVDPCWGSRMDINGKYDGGGPPWEMPELPVHIINGEVWVEVK